MIYKIIRDTGDNSRREVDSVTKDNKVRISSIQNSDRGYAVWR